MKIFLFIGLGGFLGSVLRYYAGTWIQGRFGWYWPMGTLVVNFLGCLLIGMIFILSERGALDQETRLMLAIGFCGGLTTFSSFSFEILNLLRNGHYFSAASYVAFSLLFGLLGVWAGMTVIRKYWISG